MRHLAGCVDCKFLFVSQTDLDVCPKCGEMIGANEIGIYPDVRYEVESQCADSTASAEVM